MPLQAHVHDFGLGVQPLFLMAIMFFFFLSNYFKNVILLCIIQFIFCLWMTLDRFFYI